MHISIQNTALLRVLTRLDQNIAKAEARLLQLLEPDEAHRVVRQVAEMCTRRRRIEDDLRVFQKQELAPLRELHNNPINHSNA